MDDEALEAARYPAPQEAPAENVDWAKVEQSGRGMTLKLLGGGNGATLALHEIRYVFTVCRETGGLCLLFSIEF